MNVQTENNRSSIMRAVKAKDTKPEMIVRRMIHKMGYRYRLHRKDIPGKPDIVFSLRRKAIFVHGCFWHGHDCKRGARVPKTNVEYWTSKVERNKNRDRRHVDELTELGWEVLIVWECETQDTSVLSARLDSFLKEEKHHENGS